MADKNKIKRGGLEWNFARKLEKQKNLNQEF